MNVNLPNILTFLRIGVLPILVGLLYIPAEWARYLTVFLYTLACITDYLDGYFARSLQQVSALGRLLDPIADKLLVATVLLMLTSLGIIHGWHIIAGLIILSREIFVSGLREFLAELQVRLPVSRLAKWKTAVQMVSLGVLLIAPLYPSWLLEVALAGLWLAAALTIITGYDYLVASVKHLKK